MYCLSNFTYFIGGDEDESGNCERLELIILNSSMYVHCKRYITENVKHHSLHY